MWANGSSAFWEFIALFFRHASIASRFPFFHRMRQSNNTNQLKTKLKRARTSVFVKPTSCCWAEEEKS
jgi:hypothetical protein